MGRPGRSLWSVFSSKLRSKSVADTGRRDLPHTNLPSRVELRAAGAFVRLMGAGLVELDVVTDATP